MFARCCPEFMHQSLQKKGIMIRMSMAKLYLKCYGSRCWKLLKNPMLRTSFLDFFYQNFFAPLGYPLYSTSQARGCGYPTMSRVSRLVLLQMMVSSTTSLCDYQDLGCGKRWLSIWCRVHMKHKYHYVDYWTADGWNPAAFWGVGTPQWMGYVSYWSTGFCPSTVSFSVLFFALRSAWLKLKKCWNNDMSHWHAHQSMIVCGSESWMTLEQQENRWWVRPIFPLVRLCETSKLVDFRKKRTGWTPGSTNIAGWKIHEDVDDNLSIKMRIFQPAMLVDPRG